MDTVKASPANCRVHLINLKEEEGPELLAIWEEYGGSEHSGAVVFGPQSEEALWSGLPTAETAAALLDSPIRREIARRILGGQTAVWVLLESGDAGRDEEAARFLEAELKGLSSRLRLPEPVAGNSTEVASPDIELPDARIEFSLLRLSRHDPAETFLVEMLMKTEPDLESYASEPIVFPVFGRGRALYALVGKGINRDNVEEACATLVAPCSCQTKALNPGTDLLMAVDWEGGVRGSWIPPEEPPPLVGIPDLGSLSSNSDSASGEASLGAGNAEGEGSEGGVLPLWRNLQFVLGIVIVGVVLLTLVTIRKGVSGQ
jgi:hypothetical protein